MKYMGEMLTTRTPFSEIVMGNTALVRAMIEAGTRVVTSYPGSPTPDHKGWDLSDHPAYQDIDEIEVVSDQRGMIFQRRCVHIDHD